MKGGLEVVVDICRFVSDVSEELCPTARSLAPSPDHRETRSSFSEAERLVGSRLIYVVEGEGEEDYSQAKR